VPAPAPVPVPVSVSTPVGLVTPASRCLFIVIVAVFTLAARRFLAATSAWAVVVFIWVVVILVTAVSATSAVVLIALASTRRLTLGLAALRFDGVGTVFYTISWAFATGWEALIIIIVSVTRWASALPVIVRVVSGRWTAVHVSFSSSPAAAWREFGLLVIIAPVSWGHGGFSVSFAFVAFVAVALLSETALVWAILALEVVWAGVEVWGLVGELRVEVCFQVSTAFALDGAAERWRRERVGCWWGVGRSWEGVVVWADRIRRTVISVAARAGLMIVVVVRGHASLVGRNGLCFESRWRCCKGEGAGASSEGKVWP
jgi:hypothetical protein